MDSAPFEALVDTSFDSGILLTKILAFVSDGIVVIDTDKKIRVINGVAEKLLGVSSRDLIGRPLDEILDLSREDGSHVENPSSPWEIVFVEKKSLPGARYFLNKEKCMKVPVLITASPVLGKQDQNIVGVVIAIVDRTTETEVEKMKNQFIPFAAHQLRTPLASIRWNTEMLLSGKIGTIPHQFIDTVMNIYDGTHQMIRLVNDLLSLSRIEEGNIPNDPAEIDVEAVTRSVLHDMATMIEKRGLRLNVTIPHDVPKLYLDRSRFRDAIQNILSNAVKFNKPGGDIAVDVHFTDGEVTISVKDSGIGIPDGEKRLIFEKFFRAGNAVANQTEGTGLGLYVIKYYMDEWGGSIHLESEENKGTTVRLAFPRLRKST